jgi:hypothetical protein
MISRPQQILIKRAQHDANLGDQDYRDALELIAGPGVRSSKDPRLTDEHLDNLLSYFEAIYWRKYVLGEPVRRDSTIFHQQNYWAAKNTKAENSRDRFVSRTVHQEICALEQELAGLGYAANYLDAIKRKVMGVAADGDDGSPRELSRYRAALERTLAAKRRKNADRN